MLLDRSSVKHFAGNVYLVSMVNSLWQILGLVGLIRRMLRLQVGCEYSGCCYNIVNASFYSIMVSGFLDPLSRFPLLSSFLLYFTIYQHVILLPTYMTIFIPYLRTNNPIGHGRDIVFPQTHRLIPYLINKAMLYLLVSMRQ